MLGINKNGKEEVRYKHMTNPSMEPDIQAQSGIANLLEA